MKEVEQRRKMRKFIFSRPVFLLGLVLFVLLAQSVWEIYKKAKQAEMRNQVVVEEMENLQNKKDALEASVADMNSDTGSDEELVKKFQIKKPGEEYVVILEKEVEVDAVSVEEKGFWDKIKDWFKDLF